MNFKKKYILLTGILILIFQILLYTNNNQKTLFRFFKWNVQEVSIGKLISISFFSGLFITTLLNTKIQNNKKNTLEDSLEDSLEGNETLNNDENMESKIEIPPQRDIRDAQPTISVNYRVVKNTKEKNLGRDKNYSDSYINEDDWDNDNNDW